MNYQEIMQQQKAELLSSKPEPERISIPVAISSFKKQVEDIRQRQQERKEATR